MKYAKIAQEQCTIVHKRITGRPLTDRYTLVPKLQSKRLISNLKYIDERNVLMSVHWCFPVNFSGGREMGYIMLQYILSHSLSFIWLR